VKNRSSLPAIVWPVLVVGLLLAFLASLESLTLLVTAPLVVGILTSVIFSWVLWRRRAGAIPWFEIGAVYAAVVTLYLVHPLIGFLALGGTYSPFNDARLYLLHPQAEDIGYIGWLYVCHLAAFAGAYLFVRGRLPKRQAFLNPPRLSIVVATVVVYLAIEAYGLFVGLFYNTSADTYFGTYLVARRLPLLVAQLLNHLNGIKYVLSLSLMAMLFSRYPASRRLIAAWLLIVAIITVARLGSRTELVLLVLSVTMMYDLLVRPVRPRLILGVAAAGLTAVVAFGILRNPVRIEGSSLNPFAYPSEFESLFANAVHLDHVRPTIGELPPAFYLADVAALLPQQVAPFTKIDRADWYVNRFFPEYAQAGGGLAFGTISEAVLSAGWISALMAGAALGFCFAKLHRFSVRSSGSFWVFVLYVWVTTLSYQSFRNSTFALLVLFAYRFVPAVLFVSLLATALRPMMVRRPVPSGGAVA
jgi:oligosaccharide repeat unit polymerase